MKRQVLLISLVVICLSTIFGYFYLQDEDSSASVVEAIEKVRGDNYVDYIIHQQPVENGELVFFLRNIHDGQVQVVSEFVKKTWKGWKWGYGGSFGASNVRLDLTQEEAKRETFCSQYLPSTKGAEFDSPFPMIYGIVLNPDFSRIVVKDYVTGLEKQTKLVEVNENFRLFYVLLDDVQGKKFDIIAFDRFGGILHTVTIDEGFQNN